MSDTAVNLLYFDQEEKAESKRAEVREFVIGQLRAGDANQSELWEEGKKRGYGRDRIKTTCKELEAEGRLEVKDGPRSSKVYHFLDLVVDAPAPPTTTRPETENGQAVLTAPWTREGEI